MDAYCQTWHHAKGEFQQQLVYYGQLCRSIDLVVVCVCQCCMALYHLAHAWLAHMLFMVRQLYGTLSLGTCMASSQTLYGKAAVRPSFASFGGLRI